MISNHMTSIVLGIALFLMFESFFVWALFFSNTIDWESNQSLLITFKNEIKESGRFLPVILGIISVHIAAYISLKKTLKKSKNITFNIKDIDSDKDFHNIENILIKDISYIKKGFYPLLLTVNNKEGLFYDIIHLISYPLFILATMILLTIRIFINIFSKNKQIILPYPYIILFSKQTNRVLNILPSTKKEFDNLDSFLIKNFNTNYKELEINIKTKNTSIQTESA